MVTTTIRFPEELYQQLSDYAKENDFSKNQVIKMAVREFLQKKSQDTQNVKKEKGEN